MNFWKIEKIKKIFLQRFLLKKLKRYRSLTSNPSLLGLKTLHAANNKLQNYVPCHNLSWTHIKFSPTRQNIVYILNQIKFNKSIKN
jgi:hypothetical protein